MKNRTFVGLLFASTLAVAVQSFAESPAAPANDEAVVTAVKVALAAKPELKASDLKVASKNGGEITITGPVDSGGQLYNIAETAQKVHGVKWVNNEMYVK